MENLFIPFSRNGVLFPRKINGKYVMSTKPGWSVTKICAGPIPIETGWIVIYYSGADTVNCIAYTTVDELLDFIKYK